MNMINIYNPDISKYTKSAINAIQSGWISNLGEYINLTKEKLKSILGCKYVVLTNNGTTSTHCLFMALKYKYPNLNKIYVPNNVYIAVWNTVLMEYDISNIEVLRIDIDTYNFDLKELDRLEKNSCLVIVHNIGNIIDTSYIKLKRPDLILVEDNCEGLFGKINDKYTGNCIDVLASSCSFYGNKIITSGEGGAFLTNDENVYNFINKTVHQGMTNQRYIHDVFGYNYRMTNIEAAFLYDQLNDIENILEKKEKVFDTYDKLFEELLKLGLISKQKNNNNCKRTYWMYILRINNKNFNDLFNYLKNKNIDTRPFFYPIHYHDHLKSLMIEDKNSEILSKESIMIPSSPNLTLDEQKYIVLNILEYLKNDLNEEKYNNIKNNINKYNPNESLIKLPVSIGEAIDKLSILDIKCEMIKDSRREECLKEYNILYDELKDFLNQNKYYYDILKYINLKIWKDQDIIRNITNDLDIGKLATKILNDNDARFRIKKIINELSNSQLKEQKGYNKTTAAFIGHMGMGDMINMNGAIRYISIMYDILLLIIPYQYEKNIKQMFSDINNIIYVIADRDTLYTDMQKEDLENNFNIKLNKFYKCGYQNDISKILSRVPYDFYEELDLDIEIISKFFKINKSIEGENLYKKLKQNNIINYVFCHLKGSNLLINKFDFNNINISKDEYLVIDVQENRYDKGHKFYDIANIFLNLPIYYYYDIIINAKEIHVVNSSFFCLASRICNDEKQIKICYGSNLSYLDEYFRGWKYIT